MQLYVEQMLMYARTKSVNKEYLLEETDLEECCREVLGEYRVYMEEKQVLVQMDFKEKIVLSDKKNLCFMLSQVITNSIKYIGSNGISPRSDKNPFQNPRKQDYLELCDDGWVIKPCEIQYIFEKGFTRETAKK